MGLAGQPLSHRVVEYNIRARLDPASKTLDGEETITYIHEGDNPLTTLQFHLYWNAFRDAHSTFQREMAVYGRDDFDKADAGWMEIVSLRQSGTLISPSAIRYLHPDDDNSEDRTVAEVLLPEPVLPGSTVTVRVVFRARFPKIIARAGSKHDFLWPGSGSPSWACCGATFGTHTSITL